MLDSLSTRLPENLYRLCKERWQQMPEAQQSVLQSAASPEQLVRLMVASNYAWEKFCRPEIFEVLHNAGYLAEPPARERLEERLQSWLADCEDDAGLQHQLRQFRHVEMTKIIWRDVNQLASLQETMAHLSWLADVCVDVTLGIIYREACEKLGTPVDAEGNPQQLVVLGMGKLGALELNLSSDIDLIFCFPEPGQIEARGRDLTNQQFFIRLGQRLIRLLDATTADGFVFRVDMRLRPNGRSGPLALCFDAMEAYYEEQGREWERYAFIKARVIAGDKSAGEELLDRLKPFVYRRYIDYSAIESLRDMKALINREVKRKGMDSNIKTGAGGIREVEFIAQAFQLIRGGRDPELQERSLLKVLPLLQQKELLSEEASDQLVNAYIFLRNLEHRIQALDDRQTQQLPEDELARARVAFGMGCADWEALMTVLQQHRDRVREHFSLLITDASDASAADIRVEETLQALWQDVDMDPEDAMARLSGQGIGEADRVYEQLVTFRNLRLIQKLSAQGRERLDTLMPLLLSELARAQSPGETFRLLLELLEQIVRRSVYISLLNENPQALANLVYLFDRSPWIARHLIELPSLLDELVADTLYSPPDLGSLKDELRQLILRVPDDDLEGQMEVLRQFRQVHLLRVVASEIKGTLPLMQVSDYLTFLAETILQEVLAVAWQHMVDKYGRPTDARGESKGEACEPDFAIVAYGKLGGMELGHNSDLDLVFIHGAPVSGMTDGPKPIDNERFYTRLGQRIIHILSARTYSGELYEVDARLRPSGNSGLLVSSLKAFEQYQQNKAWTWEHQALVRARVVAGCPQVASVFGRIRREILCRQRDPERLREEVLAMREKMYQHLGNKKAGFFALKQDRGGIVDIEFMVQYAILRWACDYPGLTRYTDNIRLLAELAEHQLLPASDARLLQDAYLAYRSRSHLLALRNQPIQVPEGEFAEYRAHVQRIWAALFDDKQ